MLRIVQCLAGDVNANHVPAIFIKQQEVASVSAPKLKNISCASMECVFEEELYDKFVGVFQPTYFAKASLLCLFIFFYG